jgi:hypothetical protein
MRETVIQRVCFANTNDHKSVESSWCIQQHVLSTQGCIQQHLLSTQGCIQQHLLSTQGCSQQHLLSTQGLCDRAWDTRIVFNAGPGRGMSRPCYASGAGKEPHFQVFKICLVLGMLLCTHSCIVWGSAGGLPAQHRVLRLQVPDITVQLLSFFPQGFD